jgi:hypothetical protein
MHKWRGMVKLLPFPRLSPTMSSGKIAVWHKTVHEQVKSYDLLLDIGAPPHTHCSFNISHTNSFFLEVKSLIKTDDNEKYSVMQIEIMEDMHLCTLSAMKEDIKPGTPIAVLCDEESDIQEASKIDFSHIKDCYELEKYTNGNPIYTNIPLSLAMWQAYATERQLGCS